MIFKKKKETPLEKSSRLELVGDGYRKKKKTDKALKAYKEASDLNPQNLELYEKLTQIKIEMGAEWNEEDFVETLDWTMKKQEIENPNIRDVHELLSPEYAEIKDLAIQLIATRGPEQEEIAKKIKAFGVIAVLPLIDTLKMLGELAENSKQENAGDMP